MVQGMLVKLIFNKIMERLEKTSDKRIARTHDKRISKLEKKAHEPVFTKKQHENILKRLKKLEGMCATCDSKRKSLKK
tara:strand:- start:389 stop:622 length:234 start_codon:yes stop_codon:yes gene_type:complete